MDTLCFMITIVCLIRVSIALDTISLSRSISDGMALVSKGGKFEFGFFSPGNSSNRYLGIWFKNIPIQTVVWVANRANPINGSSGMLTLNSTGNLVLTQNGTVVWYTTSTKQVQNPVAVLLDSGNLVVRNEEEAGYLWQSFDHPCDTFFAGMKLGWDLRKGFEWRLTSWKTPDDPSPGDFFPHFALNGYPEYFLMNGTQKFSRVGPWNGITFSGLPLTGTTSYYYSQFISKSEYNFVFNKNELVYSYTDTQKNNSVITRGVINQTNYKYHRFVWIEGTKTWKQYAEYPRDICDNYGFCGVNGNCRISETPVCQCLKGFSPKSPKAWNSSHWTQGCVRDKPLSCKDKHNEWFLKLVGMKVPDTSHTWLDENIDLEKCRDKCMNNCSCTAYTNTDIRGAGSGCVMWFGDFIDLKQFDQGGQDLYMRMAASELEPQTGGNKNLATVDATKKNMRIILSTTIPAICGLLLLFYFIYRARRNDPEKLKTDDDIETQVDVLDLPLFDLPTITAATDNFSIENKIGQGGFGLVYKGILADGQEIAVKRLSRSSGQGITEFINEVKLIVKLQHRNLVRLLGCCIQGQERLLVYEFMTNGSLDSFIFDAAKGKLLKWSQRFNIIFGIAKGLLYLHQDSRLRIIHRDLKASNILLDDELNPKISDFGMARAFGGDQMEGNTNRVVGTYGYMAPEYAFDGLFSIKSDVFSFGILLLEIICGNKNRALCHANQTLNLVGYAWTLRKEDKALQLLDSNIEDSCVVSEVLRCIHVSLLCVQQYPEDRPTMSSVLRMLGSDMELVEPKEPGFFQMKDSGEVNLCPNQNEISTNDELTISSLTGR